MKLVDPTTCCKKAVHHINNVFGQMHNFFKDVKDDLAELPDDNDNNIKDALDTLEKAIQSLETSRQWSEETFKIIEAESIKVMKSIKDIE
jgi:DNA-binding transcriptional regulator GbsR (MarR family)